jgi:hypothetical protein
MSSAAAAPDVPSGRTPRAGLWRRRWRALRVPLVLAGVLGAFYAPLARPGSVLATRDMVEYHLPMRTGFAHLASAGLPQWDPFAHGGQPLLSNPNYGALYPLSWLALLFPPAMALNFLVLIHAALAAWGALRLARRLGAGNASAALAAIAYACGPTFLSLLHTLNIALAMSFFPWVLERALALLDAGREARPRAAGFGLSLVLAAIFILGDPLIVAMALVAVAAFILARPATRLAQVPRLAAALALAIGLAAIQLVPTLARLAESPRGDGLGWQQSTAWSLPWQRFVELVYPTFFGDPARPELALYFGWGIHDRDYPYLVLIAVGLPLLLLGLASWTRRDAPERAAWAIISAAGIFLALGRHNPLYGWAWSHLPGVDKLRFPEKFLLLTLTAAIFAGALGWQRLLDQRDEGSAKGNGRALGAELPLALAGLLVGLSATLVVLAFRAPQLIAWFARAHSGLPLAGQALVRAISFYRRESLCALAFALGALALFALARFSRAPRRQLEGLAIALVALELWTYGHALLRTLPARDLFAPPRVARDLPASALRLFSDEPYRRDKTEIVLTAGKPSLRWARAPIERLDSRAGNLFGYAYALDKDYDLSLTRPAVRALRFYEGIRAHSELELHLLGAWSVSHLVERKPAPEVVEEARAVGPVLAPSIAPVRARPNGFALPFYRFIAGARILPDASAAERAAVAAGLPFDRVEYLIDPEAASPDAASVPSRVFENPLNDAFLRSVHDRGDHVRIVYAARRLSLLVVATTFDSRWMARVAGGPALPVYETAAGYMALLVPPGEREVTLRFRDPWVTLGAALSATTLLVALLLAIRAKRRQPSSAVGIS